MFGLSLQQTSLTQGIHFRRIKFLRVLSFSSSSEQEAGHIDRLSEEVGSVQSLKTLFLPILNVVLVALDAPPVFMRTKALRALGQIVTSDPSILSMVRQSH